MQYRFRSKSKRSKRKSAIDPVLFSAARWIIALAGTIYLSWALYRPTSAGSAGQWIGEYTLGILGRSAYLLPALLFYGLSLYFRTEKTGGYITWALGSFLTLISASIFFSMTGEWTHRMELGGVFGGTINHTLTDVIGPVGTAVTAFACGLLGIKALFGVSWRKFSQSLIETLRKDYSEWASARRAFKEDLRQTADKLRTESLAAGATAGNGRLPSPPAVFEMPPIEAPKPAKAAAPKPKAAAPVKNVPTKTYQNYRLPSLDLLSKPQSDSRSGPDEAEIRSAVDNLDRTLASFGLEAKVSGISPGPVITRYEVSPAPGVTVSSIIARTNDIALAMRAKGIRYIAPIPGKAAIGFEIPNQHSAGVTLREVLESNALSGNHRPLAFALGLSSDGSPLAADLQTLPHLLVAGATNSGKSVMMHSLIQSILFRVRPDEVKFLMIDPKRIELSLYEGIPHLYDPKTPADRVGVITHSKEASKSLKAMITVMESRYEKFQAYKVRDIEGFNAEAAKRGDPPEFYIVIVIDELADLMVVARDVVEDSIQRLAQMARAVGIHLVLATQRPSVDVITGVIKANLPARIALRVASKVDSKVILDTQGADALLGKGDMLYLAPGQDPARVQGCFVSTDEIGKVVDYLKTQGKPDYALIGGIAAVGAEDLGRYGVEPTEFIQALELVMERRRVSQDLLKSQFGSSARATNLLSLLELKGFIHKPEGTNRWDISFDQIESYLQQSRPAKQPSQPS